MKSTFQINGYKLLFVIAVTVFALDQLTKIWIFRTLPIDTYWPPESLEVIKNFFYIVHIGNEGAAWGLFQGQETFLTLFALAMLFTIYKCRHSLELKRLPMQFAFGLVTGGIAGNLLDRLIHGHVIDFLDFHLPFSIPYLINDGRYPAFNIADCGIVTGIFTYVVLNFSEASKK